MFSSFKTRENHANILVYLTYEGVEPLAEAGQQGESDEISKAGCHGCGHIIGVDAYPFGPKNHTHHNNTCRRFKTWLTLDAPAIVEMYHSFRKNKRKSSKLFRQMKVGVI